jgi:hypothetical protein
LLSNIKTISLSTINSFSINQNSIKEMNLESFYYSDKSYI